MSYWLTDPQLFLYAKGTGSDDVHLRRCKKPVSSSSSPLVVPMKPDDFDYVETVTDYLELLANTIDWDETDYKRLVKYISERRLLVNCQGFVIVELHKVDKNGDKMIDDANHEEVPAIYIRSLDVLALKPFIPMFRERPIPLRTVQVLEDVNGKAALMKHEDSNVTELIERVKDLETENIRLESKNNTLEGKVTKLTADLAAQTNALAALQEVENARKEAIWMNDFTNSQWVGITKLQCSDLHEDLVFIGSQGTYTTDVDTNVRAIYWRKARLSTNTPYEFRVVSVEDLTPNEEKARFATSWYARRSKGKLYVMRHY